jgi:hypothetical protein
MREKEKECELWSTRKSLAVGSNWPGFKAWHCYSLATGLAQIAEL